MLAADILLYQNIGLERQWWTNLLIMADGPLDSVLDSGAQRGQKRTKASRLQNLT